MRQAGILAAAGLYALEHNVARLSEDHDTASLLAGGLKDLGLDVQKDPETNIVVFGVPEGRFPRAKDAPAFSRLAREHDVWINPVDRRRLRAVTHIDVPRERALEALSRIRALLGDDVE